MNHLNQVVIAPFIPSEEEQTLFYNILQPRCQDIPIVHFLKVDYFKSLLRERRLLLRRLDLYPDDPEEGTYPEINRTQSSSMDIQIEQNLRITNNHEDLMASQMAIRSLSYVHCWFEGTSEARHMWTRYGDHNNGVCIQSSTQSLLAAPGIAPSHLHLDIGRCTYWDETHPLPTMISHFPILRKRQNYADEQEIRLVAQIKRDQLTINKEGYITLPPELTPIPINLPTLIHSVTLGNTLDAITILELSNMLKDFLPSERILVQDN